MVSLTLAIPKEIRKEMDKHPEINWSEVARQAILRKILLLRKMDSLLRKSKLTDKEALELGREVNKALSKRYKSS